MAELGGKFESLVDDSDLRCTFRVSSTQSLQCSPSLATFSGTSLQRYDVSKIYEARNDRLHTRPGKVDIFYPWKSRVAGTSLQVPRPRGRLSGLGGIR